MDNLLFENGQKNVHIFYWREGSTRGYSNDPVFKKTKQIEKGKANLGRLLRSRWLWVGRSL